MGDGDGRFGATPLMSDGIATIFAMGTPSLAAASTGGEDFLRILLLQDFNTRVVVAGAMLLGAVGGVVGTFLLLRRRALMGDVMGHAMLPGVAAAFLAVQALGLERSLPVLLLGGGIAATLAGLAVIGLRRVSQLDDDATMAIVLSGFFGLGVVLLSVVQSSGGGGQAGLEDFVFGKTASMVTSDVVVIAIGGLLVLSVAVLFFKEFRLLCFDDAFAASLGRPVMGLDLLVLSMTVVTALVGLQAVGLILVVALLVIPAAAARFLTDDLRWTVAFSSLIGAVGCWLGVTLSAVAPGLPAGAMIVLATAGLFVVALFIGPKRGLLPRWWLGRSLRRAVGRDHLLRSMLECREVTGNGEITAAELMMNRSWSRGGLSGLLRVARRAGEMIQIDRDRWRLTDRGEIEAAAMVRNHRLWEHYLLEYAHLAPSHVDRAADRIEHVLDPVLVRRLETELGALVDAGPPASPHPLADETHPGDDVVTGGNES
jgi:manganese/zinc/iron transport system permease protein